MVFKKIVSIVILLCFASCLQGCYTRCQIKSEQLGQYPKFTIAKVVTTDGVVVKFKTKKRDAAFIKDDRIEGVLKDGTHKTIPFTQVKSVYVTKFDKDKTVSWVIGSSVITAVVMSIVTSTTPPLGSGGEGGNYGGC